MVVPGGVDPAEARTAREYVALLRRLKEHSGLTYRQLEQRAAERDEVLARSTLADTLRRDALPRAEVVAALARACGAGDDVPEWIAARERLAAGEVPATDGTDPAPDGTDQEPEPPNEPPEPSDPRRGRTAVTAALVSLGTVVLLTVGAVTLLPQDDGTENTKSAATPTTSGYSRVRPARAPELCLTDGNVRVEGESKLLAVQRPCAEAVPPRVYLQGADDGRYQIQFRHPEHGTGCLTVLGDGVFKGTLEPWGDCRAGGNSQWFRVERADGSDRWRLRSAQDDALCVGVRGSAEEAGAAVVAEHCAERGGDDQVFLIGRE
ncbi:transcriptional regulator [Streptomyces sp. 13-12-16]|uniref:XRE family transcriptional regulator n=1 Tax=Streptomyces sp. 13-12-16 TaxID=1570823 RepID=UPI000A1DCD15|nr:XRE family transcriptional regulator [Streptomyces sp. 13-12-16]OSP32900.1 transcriptional regulator [Streptomyces sp. 13-12-16]